MPHTNRPVNSELNNTAALSLPNTAIISTRENDAATSQSPNSRRKQEELATRNLTSPSLPNTAIARHATTKALILKSQNLIKQAATLRKQAATPQSPEYRRTQEELSDKELADRLFLSDAKLMLENNKAFDERRKDTKICDAIRATFADKDIIDEYKRAYDEFLQDENNKENRITHEILSIDYGKDTRIYMEVVFTDTQKPKETISLLDEQFPIEINFKVKQHVDINPVIAEKNYKAAEEYAKQIVRQCNLQILEHEGEKNYYGQIRYQYNR